MNAVMFFAAHSACEGVQEGVQRMANLVHHDYCYAALLCQSRQLLSHPSHQPLPLSSIRKVLPEVKCYTVNDE